MARNVNYFTKWLSSGRQLLDGTAVNLALNSDVVSVLNFAVATGSTIDDALPVSAYAINVSPESVNNGGFIMTGYPVGARVTFLNFTGVVVTIYAKDGTIVSGPSLNLPSSSGITLLQFFPGGWFAVYAFGNF